MAWCEPFTQGVDVNRLKKNQLIYSGPEDGFSCLLTLPKLLDRWPFRVKLAQSSCSTSPRTALGVPKAVLHATRSPPLLTGSIARADQRFTKLLLPWHWSFRRRIACGWCQSRRRDRLTLHCNTPPSSFMHSQAQEDARTVGGHPADSPSRQIRL